MAGREARRLVAAQSRHLQCHSQRLQEGQRWQKALETLDEMRGIRLQPNVITYGATFIACENGL